MDRTWLDVPEMFLVCCLISHSPTAIKLYYFPIHSCLTPDKEHRSMIPRIPAGLKNTPIKSRATASSLAERARSCFGLKGLFSLFFYCIRCVYRRRKSMSNDLKKGEASDAAASSVDIEFIVYRGARKRPSVRHFSVVKRSYKRLH